MKLRVECYSGHKADERPVKFWLGDEAAEAAVAAAATGPVGVSAPTAAPSTAPSSVRQRAHAISTRAAHGAKARG